MIDQRFVKLTHAGESGYSNAKVYLDRTTKLDALVRGICFTEIYFNGQKIHVQETPEQILNMLYGD
jgi:hypothetical protein